MKFNLLLVLFFVSFISCNSNKKNKEYSKSENSTTKNVLVNNKVTPSIKKQSKGYKLMQQKCYICHFETPDPSKRNQMIAPPMLRVQEHYKPSYTNKEEFVKAVMAFTKNPSKEKTLMPGAVKKFNLMPKLPYNDAELSLIAATIYDYEFGKAPKMQMMAGVLQLNNGKKWVLKKESLLLINAIIKKTSSFKSTKIEAYNKLGKDVFNDAKTIMLDDSYQDELFNQIHIFFAGIENNMHTLMSTTSITEANKELTVLNQQLKGFHNYFE